MKPYPMKCVPIFKERIWGGRTLQTAFGKPLPADAKIGESWELADLPHDKTVIANGPFEGRTVADVTDDLAALATGGRIVVIGVSRGGRAEVDLLRLMSTRGRILGSTLRARPLEGRAAAVQAVAHHVLPLLADGRVQVPVTATFGLGEVTAAYERLGAPGKLGKVVLLPDR